MLSWRPFFIYFSGMKDMIEKAGQCALNRIFGFEPRTAHALMEHFGSAADVFVSGSKEVEAVLGPYSRYKGLVTEKTLDDALHEIEELSRKGIMFIGYGDPSYPSLLKECEDAPMGLYLRSTTPSEELFSYSRSIAVVGTRDISPYGREWCRRIVLEMGGSTQKPAIISGLALGTDICAHVAAMEVGLPTIGVMATGPENVYPYRHRDIAERMAHTPGCGLVTDYPPGTAPLPVHFLRRNRIIAGLCEALVLIESKIKGGGMMTSRLAFSYSRDVYALPGRADDTRSQGCNLLIREKIAEAITDAGSLMKSIGLDSQRGKASIPDIEILDRTYGNTLSKNKIDAMARILDIIRKDRGISVEDIALVSGMEYGTVSGLASLLESDGMISVDILRRCSINIRKSKLFD